LTLTDWQVTARKCSEPQAREVHSKPGRATYRKSGDAWGGRHCDRGGVSRCSVGTPTQPTMLRPFVVPSVRVAAQAISLRFEHLVDKAMSSADQQMLRPTPRKQHAAQQEGAAVSPVLVRHTTLRESLMRNTDARNYPW